MPAGTIAVVDWRGGALPREPNKIRPGIVVENDALFEDQYPNILVVPLTRDRTILDAPFVVRIDPTPENGAPAVSWAMAHYVNIVSQQRIRPTASRITDDQLWDIRQRIALAIGLV